MVRSKGYKIIAAAWIMGGRYDYRDRTLETLTRCIEENYKNPEF